MADGNNSVILQLKKPEYAVIGTVGDSLLIRIVGVEKIEGKLPKEVLNERKN